MEKKKEFAIVSGSTLVGALILLLLIGVLRYDSPTLLFRIGMERGASGVTDVAQLTGTFGYRVNFFTMFYESVIKENPWFGVGFLYPETEATETLPLSRAVFGDSAFISILNTMGVVGLLFYILFHVALVMRGLYIFSQVNNPVYKSFVLGFVVWYIGDWVGVFTTDSMINYSPISVKALCAGLAESMYRADYQMTP